MHLQCRTSQRWTTAGVARDGGNGTTRDGCSGVSRDGATGLTGMSAGEAGLITEVLKQGAAIRQKEFDVAKFAGSELIKAVKRHEYIHTYLA